MYLIFLCTGFYKRLFYKRNIHYTQLGGCGNAAANGDIFPLFALIEDFGYLPRIAFNLDKFFSKCGAHGKQGLTMAMGIGCNACGVTGCRIIESPKERLIATVTNNFMPCNGRFPMLIALITIFFSGSACVFASSISVALILVLLILLRL